MDTPLHSPKYTVLFQKAAVVYQQLTDNSQWSLSEPLEEEMCRLEEAVNCEIKMPLTPISSLKVENDFRETGHIPENPKLSFYG